MQTDRMLKKLRKIFIFCILSVQIIMGQSLICCAAETADAKVDTVNIKASSDKYRVMFLSSYSMNDDACKQELTGIREALPEDKYEINYEFMDTRRFNTDYDLSILYRYLRNKLYRLPKFDCYIAGDDAALSFFIERSDIFGDTPVVYFGVQNPALVKEAEQYGNITGIIEQYDYNANFDFIKKALPDIKNIKFVTDNSYIGKLDTESFTKAVKKYGRFKYDILNLSERDEKDIEADLSESGDDTVVFLQDMYKMHDGSTTTFNYMAEKLIKYTDAPVMTLSMNATDYGALGGITYDCKGSAKLAGKMAENIAKGAKASAIKVVEATPTKAVFNKKVMDKFGITKSETPKDTFYVNDDRSFWDKYKTAIIILGLLFVSMLLTILLLYRRTDKQQGLIETDNEIFRQIAKETLNFVAVISVTDSTITIRSGTWNYDGSPVIEGCRVIPYSLFIDDGERRISIDGKKDDFRKEGDLDGIIKRLEKQEIVTNSYDFRIASGDIRRRQLSAMWLNKKQNRILLYETDITKSLKDERKKNKVLKEAAYAAKRASDAKTQFISRISHDIRTPIGAILNLTEFAVADIDDKERLKDDLDKIGTSGRFLLSLINDVLDISKIDSNKIDLQADTYRFSKYISEIENIIDPMCNSKELTNELEIDDASMNLVMKIDKVRLNQITLNLLSNAVKYTDNGGKIVFAACISKENADAGELRISVQDTGIGMSDNFQKVMFDEFSQEENNPKRVEGMVGTGLGLSIVKRLIELMNGEINVNSQMGFGTKICVSIPIEIALEETGNEENSSRVTPEMKAVSGKILLAEDNEINAEIASRIFRELGVDLDIVKNGKEELDRFISEPQGTYSVIFQDIQMPIMNGYEAVTAIRNLKREDARVIPIIAMTADAFSDAVENATNVGMNEFITKPIKVDEIRDMLVKYSKHE